MKQCVIDALKEIANIAKSNTIIIDTETTGLVAPRVCEMTYLFLPELAKLKQLSENWSFEDCCDFAINYPENLIFNRRYNPEKEIHPGASEVTGIYNYMLENEDNYRLATLRDLPVFGDEKITFIAHHAPYDWGVLFPLEDKELHEVNNKFSICCTKQLAHLAYQQDDNPNLKLTGLISWLLEKSNSPEIEEKLKKLTAHSSLGDVKMTLILLLDVINPRFSSEKWLSEIQTFEKLATLCTINRAYSTGKDRIGIIPVGEYMGKSFYEVPEEYCRRLFNEMPRWITENLFKNLSKRLGIQFSKKSFLQKQHK